MKISRFLDSKSPFVVGICCLVATAVAFEVVLGVGKIGSYEVGLKHYENNETDRAVPLFKEALIATFPDPASGKIKEAVSLGDSGKTKEAEDILLSLFDDETAAARARYELGLIYEKDGKLIDAATLYRDALTFMIENKGASYIGKKTCKMCHIRQYKSWEQTKMAKTFEVLKPGIRAEAKTKFKFNPQRDYTQDAKCLECHTTGFGMPGGYKMPETGDTKAAKRANENAGTTCEACHGPGGKYKAIHKNIMKKKQNYTFDRLRKAGQYKVNAKVCTKCHNRRNPTAGSDFHFDYEKYKAEDTHKNIPLKYRINP